MTWPVSGGRISFSLDDKRMLIQSDGTDSALVMDLSANPLKQVAAIHPVSHAEISDEGKTVFAARPTGIARPRLYGYAFGFAENGGMFWLSESRDPAKAKTFFVFNSLTGKRRGHSIQAGSEGRSTG